MSFLDGFLNQRPDQITEEDKNEAPKTTSKSGGEPISDGEKQNLQNIIHHIIYFLRIKMDFILEHYKMVRLTLI